MSQAKRILVTGGARFVGSHLCDRLIGDGHNMLCVDNFFTSSKRNIAHPHPRFELMRHDLTFPLFVEVDEDEGLRRTVAHFAAELGETAGTAA